MLVPAAVVVAEEEVASLAASAGSQSTSIAKASPVEEDRA